MVDWLVHHPRYQVLVCRVHGHAISNLASHLADKHKDINVKSRNTIVTEYSRLQLTRPPNTDFSHGPRNPIPAVDGLAVQKGFACGECGFVTTSWKKLRVHHGERKHAWVLSKRDPLRWSEVELQTFFTVPGNAVHYFCVTVPGSGAEDGHVADGRGRSQGHLIDDIKEQWAYERGQQEELQKVLVEGLDKHETTNWLKRAGWRAHFKERDLAEIYACSRMPGREDDELRRIAAALDRLFFSRCIDGLKSMPLMTRLLLASPHHQDAHSRPFGPLQEKTSMDRNLTYWKRFLYYCLNVRQLDEAALLERHGFSFTSAQRRSLEQLWEHLQDEDWPEEALEEELLQVSASFWMQRLDGDPFTSPLWHFVGVLGIDGESGQFRPAHLFTYVLAGLVYVGRALLAEWAIPTTERVGMEDLGERFARVRDTWLCKATYSPMGYVLSLLLYGRKIAQETGSRLMVSWSKQGELMYFMGKPIPMDDIRSMVAEMTANAEDLLWDSLMFKEGEDVRFAIPLASIADDLTQTQRGKSFIHSNGLAGKEVEMLEDLVNGRRKREFLDKNGQWKWAGIRKYLKLVKKFEELLLLLAHFTGGQPSRGEEITGLRLVNGINRDRNVFVIDGEVVLVTQYHKSLAHFDSPKVIPRFLPERPGQLMAMYMVYIRPLTDRWEADRWALYDKMNPPSDFIWHSETGPWDSSQMSRAVAKWTHHYMGRRITLQDWRHIAIAISKKHARQRGAAKADFEDTGNSNDEEQYEIPDDLAASHTGQTAANYGVTIDVLKRLTADSLEIFGQVSHRWHKFLELVEQPSSQPALKRKGAADVRELTPLKRPKVLHLEKPNSEASKDQLILQALRTVLRDDHAQFRTAQQEEAVRLAAAKETPLVVILPTGGGKSLIFMVPAMLSGSGVTIVVAPYAELKRQLVTRCTDAGLDCKHWPEARDSWPRVVLVSAEAASSDDFLQWAADLRVRGELDRVVIDECHLTFTAADEYRRKLRGLVLLRNLGCPFVFLTGTLPPLCQREFEEAMQLQNPLYIRASSHRVKAQYSVLRVRNGRGPMEAKKLVDARLGSLAPGEKGVIYCTSHAKCKALARQLGCHYYHGNPKDSDAHFLAQREVGFQAWLRGESPYIVATAALGTGIDVPGITHVVHLEAPHSIIDYAQEAGRAGRAGERVAAVIIVEDKDWPAEDSKKDSGLELKTREVNSLIRTRGCRRSILGRSLDNDLRDCKGIDAVLCDNCQREELLWKSELSSQGLIMSQAYGRKVARGLEQMEAALEEVEELGQWGCRICWMFKGPGSGSQHTWMECFEIEECLSFQGCMEFQRKINYRRDRQAQFLSCFYCHVSQELCPDGYKTKGATCRWKHVVMPVALAVCTDEGLWRRVQELAGRELLGEKEYLEWLERKHSKLVCGHEMTNAMAVFDLVVKWRFETGVSLLIER
jgi:superfamily II DNA helicase RecQ